MAQPPPRLSLGLSEGGQGEPVVLLHSGGMSSRQWRRAAMHLAPRYRVLTPDFLGYGLSGAWPEGEPFDLGLDLAALEALLVSLGEPAHLIGHSYGGLIALRAALRLPAAVASLAVYEPVAFGVLAPSDREALDDVAGVPLDMAPGDPAEKERFLRAFVDYWNGPGGWDALRPGPKDEFRAVAWKLSREVRSLMGDRTPREAYGAIAAPTLVLSGERSPAAARRVAAVLAASIPGARLETIEGAGHMGPLTHADEFARHLDAHLIRGG